MGRNIDIRGFNDVLAGMTYRARFVRDGVYQYDAVMFYSVVGVFTGFKDNAFSIASNSRSNKGYSEFDMF